MTYIAEYDFKKDRLDDLFVDAYCADWPVVYLICNEKEMYIGETINLYNRSRQHYEKPERRKLKKLYLIADEQFNKSATLDIESWLIQYIAADGKFILQNGNGGLRNHDYYERDRYRAKFEMLWKQLQEEALVLKDLVQIQNSDLFKYSPYKSLSVEQLEVATKLKAELLSDAKTKTFFVEGKPGTGKTILAIYLMKHLRDQEETKEMKIALVVSMTSLRNTLKKVFKSIPGLKASMVVGPNEIVGDDYDLLIVDEAHRLNQRRAITNFKAFDDANRKLGLGTEGTQLDWVLMSSKKQIFFFDENQTVRPADVHVSKFRTLDAKYFELRSQMRVEGGEEYIEMINDFFDVQPAKQYDLGDYDFKVYSDLAQMVSDIKKKDAEHGLARLAAGYAWDWISKGDPKAFDIVIDGVQLRWNSTTNNWVNSENAVKEVGCIHTVQGYDLNYAGIIVGPELGFDPEKKQFFVRREKYRDKKGFMGVDDPEELKRYIVNIYRTLFTRGIKGTYVYFVDKDVEKFFRG